MAFRMVTLSTISALRSVWCWTEHWSQAQRIGSVNLMNFQHTAVLNSASEFFISVHRNSRIKYLNALLYLYTTTYFSHIVLTYAFQYSHQVSVCECEVHLGPFLHHKHSAC
jgi:hypothetical protein